MRLSVKQVVDEVLSVPRTTVDLSEGVLVPNLPGLVTVPAPNTARFR